MFCRAYQFHEGGNGNGFVWAIPVDAEFPDPEDCLRLKDVFLEPPKPPAALDNFMDAIEGDGSPWSYMCASILMRELAEFGAMWHGCDWSTHTILGTIEDGQESVIKRATNSTTGWEFLGSKPADWRPCVEQDARQIRVTFFTYNAMVT